MTTIVQVEYRPSLLSARELLIISTCTLVTCYGFGFAVQWHLRGKLPGPSGAKSPRFYGSLVLGPWTARLKPCPSQNDL